jgi:hypothetical protein
MNLPKRTVGRIDSKQPARLLNRIFFIVSLPRTPYSENSFFCR